MCENLQNKKWERRGFLKASGLAAFSFALGSLPPFVKITSSLIKPPLPFLKRKILVCIFQRGAMDGIMAVQPINDPFLQKLRPNLTLNTSNRNEANTLIDLDGKFGLHSSFQALIPFFKAKQLAIVHDVGSPLVNRSHFDAQEFMESGTPGNKGTETGWLNRALGQLQEDASPFRAVAMTPAMPRSFYGDEHVLAVENLSDLTLQAANSQQLVQSFQTLYSNWRDPSLKQAGQVSLEALRILQEANTNNQSNKNEVLYPKSVLGHSLRQIAQLIKSGIGLELAFTESNGWDTHSRQSGKFGAFPRLASDLGNAIAAFWLDLAQFQDDLVIMTMTEFGRTIHQNGSFGTDHGRASCQFILGNQIPGGKVYGSVPQLNIENLEDGRDLPVTTDFRSTFMSILESHLDITAKANIFPGWNGDSFDFI